MDMTTQHFKECAEWLGDLFEQAWAKQDDVFPGPMRRMSLAISECFKILVNKTPEDIETGDDCLAAAENLYKLADDPRYSANSKTILKSINNMWLNLGLIHDDPEALETIWKCLFEAQGPEDLIP